MSGIRLHRNGNAILDGVDWTVRSGEHWAVLGPNGSGKTCMLRVATGYMWPVDGTVDLLGRRLGEVNLHQLRRKVGWASSAMGELVHRAQSARQIVLSGAFASAALFEKPTAAQIARAQDLLEELGCPHLADRPYNVLSLGERQKVLIARALMPAPELLILDEPCAGLDLTAREHLLTAVSALVGRRPVKHGDALARRTLVYVTHHLEEITGVFSHALILKSGRVLAAGPKEEVLTGENLSRAYDLPIELDIRHGRYWLRVRNES